MINQTPAEGQAGRCGVAERLVVPMKPSNAGRGEGASVQDPDARRGEGPGDWATYQLREAFRNCRRRCTRKRTQNPPVTASTPSTTRSAARTFWRTLMLSAAPTRACRGVDRQDFEDIEAYGVERWLGELALALKAGDLPTGPYQTRVHTEGQRQTQAALGISALRDRVCMTAAMLVLEPIFEADLPSELYAYRRGETPNRRWSRWKSCCFVATRKS